MLNVNNEEIDLKQTFDDDDDFIPQPAMDEEKIDFSVDDGDLDEGFMAEDEDGVSELDLGGSGELDDSIDLLDE